MKLELDKRFKNRAAGRYGKYYFEVGILKDGPHFRPKKVGGLVKKKNGTIGVKNIKAFHGGPARAYDRRKKDKVTLARISKFMRKRKNYLRRPFVRNPNNKDIRRFLNAFFALVKGSSAEKRLINTLQAIVRNPFLRGDYGSNAKRTIRTKGFNRFGIDTGQFFTNIKASIKRRRF